MCIGDKSKYNHPFEIYRESCVKATRLPNHIWDYINNLIRLICTLRLLWCWSWWIIIEFIFSWFMNQIYNLRQAFRLRKMHNRSSIQHCLYLAIEFNFMIWETVVANEQLTRLVIANHTSIKFLCTWPHVVLIDTTYKTNNKK